MSWLQALSCDFFLQEEVIHLVLQQVTYLAFIEKMAEAMRYQRRPGRRFNEHVLIDVQDGYIWHANRLNRWRCYRYRSHGCLATLNLVDGVYIQTGVHTHGPDFQEIFDLEAISWMKTESVNTAVPLHNIFVEATMRFPRAIIEYNEVVRTLQRVRGSVRPRNPQSAEEADELLVASPFYRNLRDGRNQFYYGRVVSGNSSALVFINPLTLSALLTTEEIHMDGTFLTVPRIFNQLATLHVISFGHSLPVAYFLMTARTQELYTLCLRRLLEVCRDLHGRIPTPVRLVADYELGLLQAMQVCFPGGRARGCWFHSATAMFRYACSLGLAAEYRRHQDNPLVRDVVRMAIALALLPAPRIQEGFQVLREYARERYRQVDVPIRIALARFLTYIRTFWLERVGAERFSVGEDVNRTNNQIESWHRQLNQMMMTVHLNIWRFLRNLQTTAHLSARDYNSLREGRVIRAPRRRRVERNDAVIAVAVRSVVEGRMPLLDFLRRASNFFDPLPGQRNEEIIEQDEIGNALHEQAAFEVLMQIDEPHQNPPPQDLPRQDPPVQVLQPNRVRPREDAPYDGPVVRRPRLDNDLDDPQPDVAIQPRRPGPGRPPGRARGPGRPPGRARGLDRPPGRARGPGRPPGRARGPGRPPGRARGPGRPPGRARGPGRPPGCARRPGRPPGCARRLGPVELNGGVQEGGLQNILAARMDQERNPNFRPMWPNREVDIALVQVENELHGALPHRARGPDVLRVRGEPYVPDIFDAPPVNNILPPQMDAVGNDIPAVQFLQDFNIVDYNVVPPLLIAEGGVRHDGMPFIQNEVVPPLVDAQEEDLESDDDDQDQFLGRNDDAVVDGGRVPEVNIEQCTICMDRDANYAISCCIHRWCLECIRGLMTVTIPRSLCPICRKRIHRYFPLLT